ncbi:hypothetical protein [Mesorhizobium amorphae]|uniref:hypothetical protein n=1 Tax=Mesorhizobium amorphae TaxID=71433 RepID=UPI0011829432|nr:hypothetical protein [Mesorhizobium amorphae]
MTGTLQKKGPAEAATSLSRGSTSPIGHKNVETHNTTAGARQDERDPIDEAREKLTRIKDLNELIFLAGEGMLGMSGNRPTPFARDLM